MNFFRNYFFGFFLATRRETLDKRSFGLVKDFFDCWCFLMVSEWWRQQIHGKLSSNWQNESLNDRIGYFQASERLDQGKVLLQSPFQRKLPIKLISLQRNLKISHQNDTNFSIIIKNIQKKIHPATPPQSVPQKNFPLKFIRKLFK